MCWNRSWPSASRARSALPSPSASCARRGSRIRSPTAIAAIKKPSGATLAKGIKRLFKREPDREWRDHIEAIAAERTKKV